MSRRHKDALLRSDKILVGALVILATAAGAALGATAAYHPGTNEFTGIDAPKPAAAQLALRASTDVAEAEAEAQSARPDLQAMMAQPEIRELLKQHKCLSEALYYEARGEGVAGEKAVAEVIYNRLRNGSYGKSICDVVYAGSDKPGCQFSFTCNGAMNQPRRTKSWTQATMLAARIITREEQLNNTTLGATSFHAVSVEPDWSHELLRTVQIGNHIFYRNPRASRTM